MQEGATTVEPDPWIKPYKEWPSSLVEREALARELFGRHLIAAFDGWMEIAAEMLFEGYRYKSPTRVQKRFLDWIETLDQQAKECALLFVGEIASGVVFSILNSLDGTGGAFLQEDVMERLRVMVEIYPRPEVEAAPPLERLVVNTKESEELGIELHEVWYDWLERYSRWHQWLESDEGANSSNGAL